MDSASTGTAEVISAESGRIEHASLKTGDSHDSDRAEHWFALYTCANREARVSEQLTSRGINNFLAVYQRTRRWKDRLVHLRRPLFPGYVFVRIPSYNRLQVLQVPGVVRLVGFNGLPAALPDEQIDAVRRALRTGLLAEPHPYLTVGRRVRINGGPLEGQEGILIRRKGSFRVVVSLAQISCSMVANVDASYIEPIRPCGAASKQSSIESLA